MKSLQEMQHKIKHLAILAIVLFSLSLIKKKKSKTIKSRMHVKKETLHNLTLSLFFT